MPWLKGELQKQALEIILGLNDPNTRFQMSMLFIPSLEEDLQKQVQKQALEDALIFRGERLGTLYLRQLAPYLTGKELEGALKESLALEDPLDRAWVLIAFLPFVSDQTQMLKSIRQALVEKLLSIKHLSREMAFDFCCIRELFAPSEASFKAANTVELFAPPILSLECVNRIESHILEICEEWHLL